MSNDKTTELVVIEQAAILLETFADVGMEAFLDGEPTQNRTLCIQAARGLRSIISDRTDAKESQLTVIEDERAVVDNLISAWNAWCALPDRRNSDNLEFQTAIHDAQKMIALRIARRAEPLLWRP